MNTEHQLGLDSQEFQHTEPALIRSLTGLQIKQLAAGAEHSIALTDKGVAFVWGCGKEGQLGLGTRPSVPEPLELKVDIRIMSVSAGYYHTAIVSVDGILYTFGERDGGKLGLPKTLCCKRYNKPTEVSTIPGKIVSVSCGGTHTMALTAEGKVYAFGDGRNGQLGLGNKTTQSSKPQPIPFPEGIKIARVVCGESHTAFLSGKLLVIDGFRSIVVGLISPCTGYPQCFIVSYNARRDCRSFMDVSPSRKVESSGARKKSANRAGVPGTHL
ncbi:unnamed protein product [Ixodes persulcatus]